MPTGIEKWVENPRSAYISVSRASHDAQVFTNGGVLGRGLDKGSNKPGSG